jgi:putative protein-disulfide isomerase
VTKTLYYLFDPLCGWCYGATPAVTYLRNATNVVVQPLPAGVFSGDGARTMDDDFAVYAWSNDQRIQSITGQPFTEKYQAKVLANRQQKFDSGNATAALTAVALTEPERELEALSAIQKARYVDGLDVTSQATLVGILNGLKLEEAASLFISSSEILHAHIQARASHAQRLMQAFGVRGVPAFFAETGGEIRLIQTSAVYQDHQALARQLTD